MPGGFQEQGGHSARGAEDKGMKSQRRQPYGPLAFIHRMVLHKMPVEGFESTLTIYVLKGSLQLL